MQLRIRQIRAHEGLRLRAFRLHALADAPAAFASTLAREVAFGDDVWHARAAAGARGDGQTTIIAERNGRWVGMATGLAPGISDNCQPMLVGMFVASKARRCGTGAALVERIADWARARGTCLFVRIRTSNLAAIALYRKCGFQTTDPARALAHPPDQAEIEMLRVLAAVRPPSAEL